MRLAINLTGIFGLLMVIASPLLSQKSAYQIYNKNGKKVKYEKMIRQLSKSQVVFFGEMHDDALTHWLQFEVTKDLHRQRPLVMGAEMIEADNQDELDDYLSNKITFEIFDSTARLWRNYPTDYAPLVEYAKTHQIPFVATNIPRRFANAVYKQGFEYLDQLSDEEKSWVAPLPIPFDPNLPKYQEILSMMGDHGSPDLVKAQATKDATMAHFIYKNLQPNTLFMHYNGSYHSDDNEGILWYLTQYTPNIQMSTITTVRQKDVCKLEDEHKNVADFIICIDEDMTRSY